MITVTVEKGVIHGMNEIVSAQLLVLAVDCIDEYALVAGV
jgi:hypothetical protein